MASIFDRYTPQQVKDAKQLLDLYPKENVRKYIDTLLDNKRMVYWKGRPLTFYGQLFSLVAKTQQGLGEKYRKYYQEAKKSPSNFKSFLQDYVADERKLGFFKKATLFLVNTPQKTPLHLILSEEIERLPDSPEKAKAIDVAIKKADQEIDQEEKQSKAPAITFRDKANFLILQAKQFKIPPIVQEVALRINLAAKKIISKIPGEIGGAISGAIVGALASQPLGMPVLPTAILGGFGGVAATRFMGDTVLGSAAPRGVFEVIPVGVPMEGFSDRPAQNPGQLLSKTATLARVAPILTGSLISLFLVAAFALFFEGGGGLFPTPGEAAPKPPKSGLSYTIPFRDPSVQVVNPEEIKSQIKNNWPEAQLQNWDTIVNQSIANSWNPAFILTLWIEETGAQGVASYTDPLGCDPSHPTTDINISLGCVFNNFKKYSNNQFTDFMCMYSESKLSPCQFLTNPNFPGNIQIWYSKLVPTGPGSLALSPLPSGTKLENILFWAEKINNELQPGNPLTSFNKMVADITNGSYTAIKRSAEVRDTSPRGIYWCTNIVIDAYNLANIGGLGTSHQGVRGMLDFWKNTSGYNFIPFEGVESIKQARPGFTLFRLKADDYTLDHASIIQEISIDNRGNGFIKTLDSNSFRSWSSPISNGQFTDTSFLAQIVGFGGISQ